MNDDVRKIMGNSSERNYRLFHIQEEFTHPYTYESSLGEVYAENDNFSSDVDLIEHFYKNE